MGNYRYNLVYSNPKNHLLQTTANCESGEGSGGQKAHIVTLKKAWGHPRKIAATT